jgi:hypothetical protein
MRRRDPLRLLPLSPAALALGALSLVACGGDEKPKTAPSTPGTTTPGTTFPGSTAPAVPAPPAEDHSHDPKHGGTVVELGDHEGHLELVHVPATGVLTAYVYDAEMKPLAARSAIVNLVKGSTQVPMTPAGGGSGPADTWTATHDALKADPLDGRLRLEVGEKTYQAPLEHEHK